MIGLIQKLRDILNVAQDNYNLAAAGLVLTDAFNTTQTVKNDTVVLFALDAIAGPIKDIRIEFYLAADAAATFTPDWYATRQGDLITFVERAIPDISTIATPAAAKRYYYEYGDLGEGEQLEFRISQDNNGNANNDIDARLTYLT